MSKDPAMATRSTKRRKVATDTEEHDEQNTIPNCKISGPSSSTPGTPAVDLLRETAHRRRKLASLTREISPPPIVRRGNPSTSASNGVTPTTNTPGQVASSGAAPVIDLSTPSPGPDPGPSNSPSSLSSSDARIPFRLTYISSLHTNHTITLQSLLTPPAPTARLTTVWCFNYVHSLPFLVSNLSPSTDLSTLRIHLVHGSWRTEDPHRIRLEDNRREHPYPENVRLVPAYMPEPFGTHHSKMLVLFSADQSVGGGGMARVVIHTANMIPFDWGNMTQGVWDSGWLPSLSPARKNQEQPIGAEFKSELLHYLKAYGASRTRELTTEIPKYDFGSVRAAFIGSTPGKYKVSECHFGWPGLERILRKIHPPTTSVTTTTPSTPKIVIQISSIATLSQGAKDSWLTPIFLKALSTTAPSPQSLARAVRPKPEFSIIFPTPDEIRESLNGYDSGGAVHLKAVTPANLKQIEYMRPYLCRWSASLGSSSSTVRRAGRARAAPHIKTYIRFNDSSCETIAWALLTSANLSHQAWGSAPGGNAGNKSGGLIIPSSPEEDEREVKICSYEAGVIIYPELFAEEGDELEVVMRPVFHGDDGDGRVIENREKKDQEKVIEVGIRMPYDLPLVKYTPGEMPWSPGRSYQELDCFGRDYVV